MLLKRDRTAQETRSYFILLLEPAGEIALLAEAGLRRDLLDRLSVLEQVRN